MPIYAYRCDACGFEKDVLQKISDAPLNQCPSCGKDAFRKQVTAAGFQLKGSGWYVTDFRGNDGGKGGGKRRAACRRVVPGRRRRGGWRQRRGQRRCGSGRIG
jgi:putative FmdB family regulatory protein